MISSRGFYTVDFLNDVFNGEKMSEKVLKNSPAKAHPEKHSQAWYCPKPS